MPAIVRVVNKYVKIPPGVQGIDVCARAGQWKDLSPFELAGGPLYGPYVAANMENAWQYSKVYPDQLDERGEPNAEYWAWAQAGWANPRAVRYPRGKGAKPAYVYWDGAHLDYVGGRIGVYAPLYAAAVAQTEAFERLRILYANETEIWLRDYDGWDHIAAGYTPSQAIQRLDKKMGHGFVLWLLLTGYDRPGEFQASRYCLSV